KVQKGIEDVFGSSWSISYQDRKNLPYTNAVIHEMQRVKYVMFLGGPRQSSKDVMRGYLIPKGTFIIADLCSVLLDPEQWETLKNSTQITF
ncbi:putative Cytochrome P450 2J2-like protein, partial [Naja naja]